MDSAEETVLPTGAWYSADIPPYRYPLLHKTLASLPCPAALALTLVFRPPHCTSADSVFSNWAITVGASHSLSDC